MLAVITARGGSKRLPGKNLKILAGKPLIAYTIEAALKSEKVTRVIVNTDDDEIAEVARDYGAEVPFIRPAELAVDRSSSIDVLRHTLEWFAEFDTPVSALVLLQPTSPFRTETHIDEAIELFYQRKADAVIGFCREEHPVSWHKLIDDNSKIQNLLSDGCAVHRDALTYYPNGSLYVLSSQVIKSGAIYESETFAYLMDREASVDIDTAMDFLWAEFLFEKKQV